MKSKIVLTALALSVAPIASAQNLYVSVMEQVTNVVALLHVAAFKQRSILLRQRIVLAFSPVSIAKISVSLRIKKD